MTLQKLLLAARKAGVPEKLLRQASREHRGRKLDVPLRYFVLGGKHTFFSDDAETWNGAPGVYVIDTTTIQ